MSAQPLEPFPPLEPPPTRPRRRPPWRPLAAAAVVVLVATVAWAATTSRHTPTAAPAASPTESAQVGAPAAGAPVSIVYMIEALDDAGQPIPQPSTTDPADWPTADVTYEAKAGTAQATAALLPDTRVVQDVTDAFRPYVSAQLAADQPAGVGGIRCSIALAGQVIASNDSTGEYSIATCHL